MGDQPFQQVGDGGVGGAGGAGDERHLGGGMAGPGFQQAVEYQRGDFGVGAGPVRLAVVQAEIGRQRGQVVFGNGGQEYGRQVPSIVVAVGEREMVGAQKAQVKGDVVADDGQLANEVRELICHPVERGRPFNLRRADRGPAAG